MSLAARIVEACCSKGVMVTCAESCTGGMVAVALTDVAGSSSALERGFVTYSNAAKVEMLGVSPQTLTAVGAVSQEVAIEMAQGALAHSQADLAVSITGIAGPGGSDHKPEGRVCFAVATQAGVQVETQEFGALGRGVVRTAARDHALALLADALDKLP
ncbi:CinA family protein [Sulfitobacter sp. M57]|uniref:CinA family protein n=1 Tax=unclassified Sulfitobacter TaxID=196795 RepID=UPI0023E09BF7|nr:MULTISPECIES: CinA family protein [unclassified Sulfitobacter]MDF3413688.1 CinA family protein [Sulfitobacter sp. KE5]MDF3421031.1 CinA family protein [Sulfitobacter sp. KE43]MDF3432234.1 CinA family protein [Sulfitobacter sp. KE42]MDF3457873.1 CinA family protein [Sulfitobacter sp. S74]MDF3461774.1 CinA family protein [Sulfitobacter sp. Ks18]